MPSTLVSARHARRSVVYGLLTTVVLVASLFQGTAHADEGYRLPWTAGVSYSVDQGWNGTFSHTTDQSRYAYDFAMPEGTALRAVKAGTISAARGNVPATSCGGADQANNANYVTVNHSDGTATLYLHLSRVAKLSGTVAQGEVIGWSGKTGWTGCYAHLHFQRQAQGAWITNSRPIYFDEYPGQQLVQGRSYTSQNGQSQGPPSAPTNLSASVSGSSVTVRWTDTSSNESAFSVWRWNGSAWAQIATVGANTTAYTDGNLGAGTWYHTVCAYNSTGGNCASGYSTAQVSSSRSEVVVDQTSSGFSRNGCPYWYSASYGYGGSTLWTYVNGSTVSCSASWNANLGGGNYEVYVFVPRAYATTRNARYEVVTSGGSTIRTVNQNNYYDAWVSLGTFNFSSGSAPRVRLADNTGEAPSTKYQIAFDAVRLTPR